MPDRTNAERQKRFRERRAKQHEQIVRLEKELALARQVIATFPRCQEAYDQACREAEAERKAQHKREMKALRAKISRIKKRSRQLETGTDRP